MFKRSFALAHMSGLAALVGRAQNLICDRASNIQKLQRSPIPLMQPDEKAKLRHAWYRKQKAWEAFRASLPEENRL